jgi:hypothetical protein
MDEAARIRQAASDAVTDIEPAPLRDVIGDVLADASMAPGTLALLSARAVDESIRTEPVLDRAAGVQLIYEGLRLTRTLAHDQPWADRPPAEHTEPNMDVLAADVLVSRGFYLLARTEAADAAVETVQAFGRDQTLRREADPEDALALDRNLETSVLELAVIAGTTAGEGTTTPGDAGQAGLLEFAADRGSAVEPPFPSAAEFLPDSLDASAGSTPTDQSTTDDHVQQSATDP